jgi:hypothetical protein
MNDLKASTDSCGLLVVVVSFPRSGTHFLIDFLRKNFAPFGPKVPIWQSSEVLYLDLDRVAIDQDWRLDSTRRESLIVKTHQLPFSSAAEAYLREISFGRRIVYLTPVRDAKESLRSYARFVEQSIHQTTSVESVDPIYCNGMSTGEVFDSLFNWAMANSHFVDVERGQLCPNELAKDLGEILNLSPKHLANRLPRRRVGNGFIGEAIGRLSGRESSDVVIPKRPLRSEIVVPKSLDALTEKAKARALPKSQVASTAE